jgi:hypothetical protein
MDRETFAQRLHQASIAARDFSRQFFLETLPDEMLFRVRLNQSYEGNRLDADERLYPDDSILNLTEKLARCTGEEAVNVLWREGRVPEWVDISVVAKTGSATIMQLVCCGRFASDEQLLYHAERGQSPFQVVGPNCPPDFQGKFSIYAYCEALNLAEVKALEPHRDNVRFLTLLGPGCNDATLESLPTFPAMEGLELAYTSATGSGLRALDSQHKIRVLVVVVQQHQQLDLGMLPHLPLLNTLRVWRAPSLRFDFGDDSPKLPNLNRLEIQCSGVLRLDGRLPGSMSALTLVGQSLKGTLACCDKVEDLRLSFAEGNEGEINRFVRNTNGVKFLDLSKTPVSGALVMQFVNRWPLQRLDVSQTEVSDEFATQLAQLRPGLSVVHNKGIKR